MLPVVTDYSLHSLYVYSGVEVGGGELDDAGIGDDAGVDDAEGTLLVQYCSVELVEPAAARPVE